MSALMVVMNYGGLIPGHGRGYQLHANIVRALCLIDASLLVP